MRYVKYAPRTLEEQDAYMWEAAEFDFLVNEYIPNRSITPIFEKYLIDGASILEGGCGNGSWVKYLNDKGYDCIGVDINEVILKVAEQEQLNIKKDDIEKLSFLDNTFDAYLSLGVVEHNVEGPECAIREAYRVLKPGGYFLVSTPCNNWLRKLVNHPLRDVLNLYYRLKGRKLHFVEYRFERAELKEYIKKENFNIVEVVPNDYRLDSNEYCTGLSTDWPFLRDPTSKYRLNALGRMMKAILKHVSPYLVISGVLIVAQKPKG